ncbi:MAG: DUF3299 domain-containing protein [Pirellulales bacterium]
MAFAGCGSDGNTAGRGSAVAAGANSQPAVNNPSPADVPAPLVPAPKVAKADVPPAPVKSPDRGTVRTVNKTFDDVKFDQPTGEEFRREMIGPKIEALAGQRIRIRGYILPTAQKRGIKQFVLVRDNQECCFGPGAALYDCILVEMQPGRTAEFSIRPVAVEGTFGIDILPGPDDKPLAIYHLEGETVR